MYLFGQVHELNLANSSPVSSFGHILEILVELRHVEGLPEKQQCAVAHVQWLDHASKRLEEAHHPRELFLLPSCEQLDARCLKDKLNVHVIHNNAPHDVPVFTYNSPDRDFFLRYVEPSKCLPCSVGPHPVGFF